MKRSLFRSLTISLSIFLFTLSSNALFAQGPDGLGYRAYWPVIPLESTGNLTVWDFAFEENGTDPVALVAGSYERIDRPGDTGFVYDHSGLIDPTQKQKFWDLLELVGGSLPSWVPTGFDRTRIYGVNSSGRICGSIWDSSGTTNQNVIGFYIDLTDPQREMKQLPAFYTTAARSWGWKVNEIGDILIVGTSSDSYSEIEVSVYSPEFNYLVHVRKNQNEPFFFNGYDRLGFNSNRNILGELPGDTFFEPCLKHRAIEETSDVNGIGLSFVDSGETTNFQDYYAPTEINENSQFGCRTSIQRRRNKWDYYNTRVAADGSIEWQNLTDFPGWVDDINNSGDLFWGQQNETPTNAYYLHEGDPNVVGDETFIEDFFQLVIPASDPNGVFQNNGPSDCILSDRDSTTGFGWVAGRQLSPVGSATWDLFLLIPEVPAPNPTVSVDDVTIDEGNAGTTTDGQFTVTLSELTGEDVTVPYEILDGTATTGDDYTAIASSGLLTFEFSAGETSKTVEFTIVGDDTNEPDETFTIVLGEAVGGATVTSGTGTATIKNDEVSNVTMSVDDPSVTEGDRKDKSPGEFTITLSAASASDVQVWYQVSNGSAGNKDYRMVDSASGLLTFAAGDTSETVRFDVLGDTRSESDETFTIELSDAFGATISKSVGTATIIDND